MHVPSVDARREPLINVPTGLLVWIAALVAIHAGRMLLPDDLDLRLLIDAAFIPAPWTVFLELRSATDVIAAADVSGDHAIRDALARFVLNEPLKPWTPLSYSLLHGSWAHVGLNCLWFLAFGALVVRALGYLQAALLWVACALGGAAAQWVSAPLGVVPMIGASASISGFMAMAVVLLNVRPGAGIWSFLRSRQAMIFIGTWLVANALFAVMAEPLGLSDAAIAWQAHVGGFVVGLLLAPILGRRLSRP